MSHHIDIKIKALEEELKQLKAQKILEEDKIYTNNINNHLLHLEEYINTIKLEITKSTSNHPDACKRRNNKKELLKGFEPIYIMLKILIEHVNILEKNSSNKNA